MEKVEPLLSLVLLCIPYILLAIVSYPPKPRLKLMIKGKEPLMIPEVCIVTGKPATEQHLIRSFKGTPYYLVTQQIYLPFSEEGWITYCKQFPVSLKIFKGGINVLSYIPFLGTYSAIYLWTPFAGILCGLVAIIDLLMKKRQPVKLHRVKLKKDNLIGIKISGVNPKFAEEFNRLNGI